MADIERPPDLVVSARALTKTYGELVAVDDVTVQIRRGDVFGLLGPNGAGKTTLLRMMLGLVRPDRGGIEIAGVPVQPVPAHALRGVAGFVETPRFYPYLTARANLELLARLDGREGRDRIGDVLERVDLTDRAADKVRGYSYGMVQRLGVAAALLRSPELLVLDEPTNGLDPAGIRDMRALVRRLSRDGLTILLSSHHMDEVDLLCSRVAILRRGELVFDGSTAELRSRAGSATRHLVTDDNALAMTLLDGRSGVVALEEQEGTLVFDAADTTVEQVSRELVGAGLAIRTLHAPSSALETLFFRLTESTGSVDPDDLDGRAA